MSPSLLQLVDSYGLIAIFLGCVAEGESFAVLGGFLAHQGFFSSWNAFLAIFLGATLGDALFYVAGRFFQNFEPIARLKTRPGFDRAFALVNAHPAKFVLLNRYAYGFRLIGGVAAGMADIPAPRFLVLNILSSLIWATLFGSIGYFFGLGVEKLIGDALHQHHRLLIGLGIGGAVAILGGVVAHHLMATQKRNLALARQAVDNRQPPHANHQSDRKQHGQ